MSFNRTLALIFGLAMLGFVVMVDGYSRRVETLFDASTVVVPKGSVGYAVEQRSELHYRAKTAPLREGSYGVRSGEHFRTLACDQTMAFTATFPKGNTHLVPLPSGMPTNVVTMSGMYIVSCRDDDALRFTVEHAAGPAEGAVRGDKAFLANYGLDFESVIVKVMYECAKDNYATDSDECIARVRAAAVGASEMNKDFVIETVAAANAK